MITEDAISNCPEGREGFSRRQFLRGATLFGGLTVLSANGVRYTFAASTNEVPDVVITLVLRGGFDSLSAVVPTDEKLRANIFFRALGGEIETPIPFILIIVIKSKI